MLFIYIIAHVPHFVKHFFRQIYRHIVDKCRKLCYNNFRAHLKTVGGESCSRKGVEVPMIIELILKVIAAVYQLAAIYKIVYDVHKDKRK